MSKRQHTPASAAVGIEHAIRMLEGRWKLVILFHLFGGKTLRFSDLERAIAGISQKMLTQQLRQLEQDRIVTRIVHASVPPKVEYHLTEWGQSLCPALDRLLTWAEHQPSPGHPDGPDKTARERIEAGTRHRISRQMPQVLAEERETYPVRRGASTRSRK